MGLRDALRGNHRCGVCARLVEACICDNDRPAHGQGKARNERNAVRTQVITSGPFGTRRYSGGTKQLKRR